jgi:hypothetical protein
MRTIYALLLALGVTVAGVACEGDADVDDDVEDAADDVEDAVEDAADDVEDAVD